MHWFLHIIPLGSPQTQLSMFDHLCSLHITHVHRVQSSLIPRSLASAIYLSDLRLETATELNTGASPESPQRFPEPSSTWQLCLFRTNSDSEKTGRAVSRTLTARQPFVLSPSSKWCAQSPRWVQRSANAVLHRLPRLPSSPSRPSCLSSTASWSRSSSPKPYVSLAPKRDEAVRSRLCRKPPLASSCRRPSRARRCPRRPSSPSAPVPRTRRARSSRRPSRPATVCCCRGGVETR